MQHHAPACQSNAAIAVRVWSASSTTGGMVSHSFRTKAVATMRSATRTHACTAQPHRIAPELHTAPSATMQPHRIASRWCAKQNPQGSLGIVHYLHNRSPSWSPLCIGTIHTTYWNCASPAQSVSLTEPFLPWHNSRHKLELCITCIVGLPHGALSALAQFTQQAGIVHHLHNRSPSRSPFCMGTIHTTFGVVHQKQAQASLMESSSNGTTSQNFGAG